MGNVGELFSGVEVFEDAQPDDGLLEVGVVTAEGLLEWSRMIGRAAVGTASKSRFAQTTKARSIKVTLSRKVLYELDGGDRTKLKSFKVKAEPAAISVCVPPSASCSGLVVMTTWGASATPGEQRCDEPVDDRHGHIAEVMHSAVEPGGGHQRRHRESR